MEIASAIQTERQLISICTAPLPPDATLPVYQVVLREEQQRDPQTGGAFIVRVVLEMAVDTMRWRQLQMRTPC